MVKSRWSRYPRSSGTAVWDEGEVCKLRFSAEVNPQIQHVPADLLQTKSQSVIFSFYILLEFLSIWTPLQWSVGAPIHRQSMYRAISSSPTQPQIASATLPSTHPYSSLTNLSKLQWATAHTCAGWFVSRRPNIPPPQSQQPVSVITSVKEQQQAELMHQRSQFQWWRRSGLYTEILALFPVIRHFFQDFLSRRLINHSHNGSCSSSYTGHGVLPPERQPQEFVIESNNT